MKLMAESSLVDSCKAVLYYYNLKLIMTNKFDFE